MSADITAYGQHLSTVIQALDLDAVDIVAFGTAGQIALELAKAAPGVIDHTIFVDPWVLDDDQKTTLQERYAPPLEPTYYGGHLLAAWGAVRDSELYWPWYETNPAHALGRAPHIDPEDIHVRTMDVLKASAVYPALMGQSIDYPVADGVSRMRGVCDVRCQSGRWPPAASARDIHQQGF